MTETSKDQWKEVIDAVAEMLKKLADTLGK
jgi:hypothetical protein